MDEPRKLEVKDARTLANELVKKSETKPELKPVEVPDKPPIRVEVTAWEKVWAVLGGYLNDKVKDAADGRRVELPNPFSVINIAASWWKILIGGIVVGVLILAVLRYI